MANEMNDLTKNLTSFADSLGNLFGPNCEVSLFIMKGSNHELKYSVNNQVTFRKYREHMNHYELEALNKAKSHNGYTVFSYTTKGGQSIKAALSLIDSGSKEEQIIAVVSFDLTDFLLAKNAFQRFSAMDNISEVNSGEKGANSIENITTLLERLVSDVVNEVGKPISYLSKEEKVKIVNILDNKGVFLIKGSVEYVAEKLCVSRYTIYNYLEEIR
ncbi:MAG: helix-turn-helix domain-containing protein [Tissierellales bacterium]